MNNVFTVAKTLGEICNWSISNLKMQKILYLSHMACLGRHRVPLIKSPFEAWDHGPIQPNLYHKIRGFGSDNVKNVFYGVDTLDEGDAISVLRDMSGFCSFTPGELVGITHIDGGPWSKSYRPNSFGMVIRDSLIQDEYARIFLHNDISRIAA